MLWEAAYLGVVGIALGLVGGGLLSLLLIKVINKQSFGWTIQMILPFGALAQAVGLAAAAYPAPLEIETTFKTWS